MVLFSSVGGGVCISNEFLSWLSAWVIALVTNWEGYPLAVKFSCIFLVASILCRNTKTALFSVPVIFALLNVIKNVSDVTNMQQQCDTFLTQFGATTSLSIDTDSDVSFKPQ